MTEWKTQVGDETIYRSCAWSPPGCHPVGCGLLVHVKDGIVTKVEGDPEHPITKGALCPRCIQLTECIYHPDRIIYPMKRAREDRGKDKWERCSWDEALDMIEKNAKETIAKYGPEAICAFEGTGREANNYGSVIANCVFGTPNIAYVLPGLACYTPRAYITAFVLGGGFPELDYAMKLPGRYDDPQYRPPEVMVLWGKEPLRSNPDGMFGHSVVEIMQKFPETKLIMVDPRIRWIGTRAEHVLQVRPGTDIAMAMAWLYVIINEELYDKEFVDEWTYGIDKLKERVNDPVLGCTPARAAEICGVPEEEIVAAARLYGNARPGTIAWGLAVDQNTSCVQLCHALLILMTITGSIDAPGGTTLGAGDLHASHAARGDAFGSAEDSHDLDAALARQAAELYSCQMEIAIGVARKEGIISDETFAKRIGVQTYPAVGDISWGIQPDEFLKTMETGKPYALHMAMFSSSNPIGGACAGEPQRWYNALKKLDFCFATEIFMNPTVSACCDLVLPLASTLEHDQMVVTHFSLNMSFFGAQHRVVQVGECKSDIEIMIAMGQRMHPEFWNQFTCEDDYIEWTLGGNLKWKTINDKVVVMNEEPYYKYKLGMLRADGKPGFPTQTGRIEYYSYALQNYNEDPLPYYEPTAYGPDSTPELMEKYPFVLTTGARRQEFFHSEHRQLKSMRSKVPYPEVDINPEDAEELGIRTGDWVEISTPYGACRQVAKVTPTIKKGITAARHGWWYPEQNPEDPNLFGAWKSNINVCLPNSVNDQTGIGNTFKCMICQLKKVDGMGDATSPKEEDIFVEPSRAAEFTLQQEWRPATAPEYADMCK